MSTTTLNYQTAPGHQVLAAAGKTTLRPGGRRATEQLLNWANLQPEQTVLELAASFGESAIAIARRFGVRVVGIEKNPDSVAKARANIEAAGLSDRIEIVEGDIFKLDAIDRQFDCIFAEAILTMQSQPGKEKMARLLQAKLKPDGQLLSHEMLARGDEQQLHKTLAQVIRVSSQPLSQDRWRSLWETVGLQIKNLDTGALEMLTLPQLIRDEGLGQTIRIARNILANPQLRNRVFQMRKTFLKYHDDLGYIVLQVMRMK
jgi:predicted O-methyltransferase YrrM